VGRDERHHLNRLRVMADHPLHELDVGVDVIDLRHVGCGFRGGPIFPAIFLGIALASLTVVWFDVSPTLAVAVGTAAGMAAQTRLIVTPVLLSTLLVGSQGLDTVPAAVLATASAWLAMALVDKRNERSTVAVPPGAA